MCLYLSPHKVSSIGAILVSNGAHMQSFFRSRHIMYSALLRLRRKVLKVNPQGCPLKGQTWSLGPNLLPPHTQNHVTDIEWNSNWKKCQNNVLQHALARRAPTLIYIVLCTANMPRKTPLQPWQWDTKLWIALHADSTIMQNPGHARQRFNSVYIHTACNTCKTYNGLIAV